MILRINLYYLFYTIGLFYTIATGEPLEPPSSEYDANSTNMNSLSIKYLKTNDHRENNKIHHKRSELTTSSNFEITDSKTTYAGKISRTAKNYFNKDSTGIGLEDAVSTEETWGSAITHEDSTNFEGEESTTQSISESTVTNNLECTSSDALKNVSVTDTGTEWIYLVWNITCVLKNTTISLKIQTCEDHECSENEVEVLEPQEMRYNVTNLNPCTEYNVSVTLIMGRNSFGDCLRALRTSNDITTIEGVNDLYVQNYTTRDINISWTPPKRYAKCLQQYLIYKCEINDCLLHGVTDQTNYIIRELKPCTPYKFQIQIQAGNATSNRYNITQQTQSPRIGPPLNSKANPGNYSLYIHWEKPEFGSECLLDYRIIIEPFIQTENTNKTSIGIHNLRACMKYDIYINAVTKSIDDGPRITFQGTTGLSAPSSLVTYNDTQEAIVTKHNVSMLWNVQNDEKNNCSMTFQTICEYVSVNGQGYNPVNRTDTVLDIGPSNITLNVTVNDLSPYTTYRCWAMVFNEAGYKQSEDFINLTTSEDVPSAPILDVTNITESQFSLIWEKPIYLAGILNDVEMVLDWKPMYSIPDWCVQNTPNPVLKNINASIFHHKYSEGLPFVNYTAKMRVKTAAGWGSYSDPKIFNTKISVPGKISNLSCVIHGNKENSSALSTILSWGLPCSLNGILDLFSVTVYGERINHSPHSFSILKNVTNHFHVDHLHSLNLHELKGEYNYTIQVSAKVLDVGNFGMSDVCGFMYPAGIPPQPDDEYIKSITIDPYKARRSASTAALLLPLFPDINGDIKYYAIMVSGKGYSAPSNSRLDLNINDWPNASTWEEAMLKDFSIPYQATRPRWTPSPNDVIDYGHMKAVRFVLGEDSTCREISSNTDKRLYCNGPLKPDTYYDVRMRAFTSGGFTDSKAFVIKTNSELNIVAVIGIVFGILFLGILTTMMLLVRKCSPQVVFRKFMQSEMTGSPVPTPFTRKKFISHCQQLIDNPGKLSNEFKLLQTLSVDLQMPANSGCLQANKKKNRYLDILPYDFSRVKLKVIDNDPNTDYINASFIRGYSAEDEYIACQGPKEETTYDFWRMVDEYDVKIIVMLTELIEKGNEKCYQYFPKSRETFTYEEFTIRCSSELDFRTYTQRTLIVQKNENKRSVTHLQFKDWPDHDVPEDFDQMINFCQIMRKHTNANKGSVVVHCSAGIGRTGTLIAIDILLQHLRDNKKIDVFGTVYRLRHHRINMVQREPQYAYIYNCIKQVLKNPYFSKTYKPPPVDPIHQSSSKTIKETSTSSLVSNFECNSM